MQGGGDSNTSFVLYTKQDGVLHFCDILQLFCIFLYEYKNFSQVVHAHDVWEGIDIGKSHIRGVNAECSTCFWKRCSELTK